MAKGRSTVRISRPSVLLLVAAFLSFAPLLVQGQSDPTASASSSQAPAPGARPNLGIGIGELLTWENVCVGCHKREQNLSEDAGKVAPPLDILKQFPAARIYESLTVGSMRAIGESLTTAQKTGLSEWIGLGTVDSGNQGDIAHMSGQCAENPAFGDPEAAPHWNGWSAERTNTRSQSARQAGLSSDQVPDLKLKWAFGVPNAAEMYSQPSIVSGRVYFGSDNKYVYSLDADTGCVYWSFPAEAGIRSAPVVGPIQGHAGADYAVYFGDVKANVYAVNAQTGELLWKAPMAEIDLSRITAAPSLYQGVLYVSFTTLEGLMAANPSYECCKGRGSVAALNAHTGEVLWRTSVIQEPLTSRGTNSIGTPIWGPAGAGVWSAPTIDPKRGLVYVGTGNAHTQPAAKGSDALVAMNLETGRIQWVYQDIEGDAWLLRCEPGVPFGNCPENVGPDWDFGSSPILAVLPDRSEVLVGASKGGIVVAVDPDDGGAVRWRTNLAKTPPTARGLILFGDAVDGDTGYYPLQTGGVVALNLADGSRKWAAEMGSANPDEPARAGHAAAATVIPGAVFFGGWDGVLQALSADGKPLWKFNTARSFATVNGVEARGGSMGAPGATVANGMLLVGSGHVGVGGGMPGNVILAFAVE